MGAGGGTSTQAGPGGPGRPGGQLGQRANPQPSDPMQNLNSQGLPGMRKTPARPTPRGDASANLGPLQALQQGGAGQPMRMSQGSPDIAAAIRTAAPGSMPTPPRPQQVPPALQQMIQQRGPMTKPGQVGGGALKPPAGGPPGAAGK